MGGLFIEVWGGHSFSAFGYAGHYGGWGYFGPWGALRGGAMGYLGLALVFVWGGVLRGEFDFCFSGVFS